MLPSGIRPYPLIGKWEFQKKTNNPDPREMRGPIGRIDEALGHWGGTIEATLRVYKECRRWLKEPETEAFSKQRLVVRSVLRDATMWLCHLDPKFSAIRHALNRFEVKQAGGAHAGAIPLAGVYQHERALYSASGKRRAPSASLLDARFFGFAGKFKRDDGTPVEFGDLTDHEYLRLDGLTGGLLNVIYMKKMERLQHLVLVSNQKFVGIDDKFFSTESKYGWPYAIDKYGNLFCRDDVAAPGQFNHSSFNAGKDVICAGFIKIENGDLKLISNNSGHYKPRPQQLHNAVQALINEGANLNSAEVEVELHDYTSGRLEVWLWEGATNFGVSNTDGGKKIYSA